MYFEDTFLDSDKNTIGTSIWEMELTAYSTLQCTALVSSRQRTIHDSDEQVDNCS
jgi:hypothetical protein